jgi:hypothetical protein
MVNGAKVEKIVRGYMDCSYLTPIVYMFRRNISTFEPCFLPEKIPPGG